MDTTWAVCRRARSPARLAAETEALTRGVQEDLGPMLRLRFWQSDPVSPDCGPEYVYTPRLLAGRRLRVSCSAGLAGLSSWIAPPRASPRDSLLVRACSQRSPSRTLAGAKPFCFLEKLSEVRMLTTSYSAKNDHRWVTFISLKTIDAQVSGAAAEAVHGEHRREEGCAEAPFENRIRKILY